VPQRVDVEGPGDDAEAKRAIVELQLCQRGFCGTGFLNTYFQI